MLMQEFTDMTGFEPTQEEYSAIEAEYLSLMMDKQAFCKDFVERGEPARLYKKRAECIETLRRKLAEMDKDHEAGMVKLMARVAQLQEELDRELDWKLAEGVGTHMEQDEYEDLAKHGAVMSDERAKQRVCREFGFDFDRVEIKRCAEVFERNKYGELWVREINVRPPVYEAEGKDYVRFDCAGYQYEMVNGELMRYED